LQTLLEWAGLQVTQAFDINAVREQQLERLADILESSLAMDAVQRLLQ
jgi:adenosylcobyric acid synthase